MLKLSVASVVLAVSGCVSAQSGLYGQCGGTGWSGATTCSSGVCTVVNPYYSQCLPGTPASSSSSASTASTVSTASTGTTTASTTGTATSGSSTSTPSAVYTIIAGGENTNVIATYRFDSGQRTLKLTAQSQAGQNPGWVTRHPKLSNVLYATNEFYNGAVQSFTINSDGSVKLVATQSSGGSGPAHVLPLSTGEVAIMNYDSGTGMIIPTSSDGLHFPSAGTKLTFSGSPSHPHEAYEYNGEVFVPDLGANFIWRLNNQGGTWKNAGSIGPHPAGSGPRHIEIVNSTLFVLHELASTLSAQPLPPLGSNSAILSTVSIVPPNPPAGNQMAAAEILIPAPNAAFPTAYIYASNRNKGTQDSRGDAITILTNNNGTLSVVGYTFTGIDQIRGMRFGGPDDRYLIASGVEGSAGVLIYERTNGGAGLSLVAKDTTLPTRSSFVWL